EYPPPPGRADSEDAGRGHRLSLRARPRRDVEFLDAVRHRYDPCDLLADGLSGVTPQQLRPLRIDGRRQVAQNSPFAAGLTDLVRDLRTKDDAPLCRGLRATAFLLVARSGRLQDYLVFGVDEHLIGEDDVLMHAQRNVLQCARDIR